MTTVQVVVDIACAHSYVGVTRLARAVERRRAAGETVEVSFLPFQLAPHASGAATPLLEALKRHLGPGAREGAARMAADAAADGLTLDYERALATNTFEAHRLIALAAAQGLQEEMTERLFRAHFTDGLHIGDPATLAALAAEVGVTFSDAGREELEAVLDRVRSLGVRGVPVFFFGDGTVLSGSQSEQVLDAALAGNAAS
ncbi:DsbA family protein (plasmid) [Streptomyces sp. NBC_01384]|uniref:DsbA family oxidoreductase n=1 Tax=Streptomyces sp. NBC_01384 TaxID=2903847 RepID=UPI002F90F5CC